VSNLENEMKNKIQNKLKDLLKETGFVRYSKSLSQGVMKKNVGKKADIVANIVINNSTVKLIIELKNNGEPRHVRTAIQQLMEYKEVLNKSNRNIYGIIGAPYISEDSARLCKEKGIGYIDLAGNAFLKFNKVFIEKKNYPNLLKERKIIKNIFTPKSSRILRIMLSNPQKKWQLQELAKKSEISIGQAFKVKERLFDLEYVSGDNKYIFLKRPGELLSKWAENYNYKKNKSFDYFIIGEPKEIEQKIADYCNENKIKYAFSLFSGASLIMPYTRYNRIFVYIMDRRAEVVNELQLKPVDSGPNITILEPYDEGVFQAKQVINNFSIVGNVQLYLDLVGYKGRGEEAANILLEEKIKKQW